MTGNTTRNTLISTDNTATGTMNHAYREEGLKLMNLCEENSIDSKEHVHNIIRQKHNIGLRVLMILKT